MSYYFYEEASNLTIKFSKKSSISVTAGTKNPYYHLIVMIDAFTNRRGKAHIPKQKLSFVWRILRTRKRTIRSHSFFKIVHCIIIIHVLSFFLFGFLDLYYVLYRPRIIKKNVYMRMSNQFYHTYSLRTFIYLLTHYVNV